MKTEHLLLILGGGVALWWLMEQNQAATVAPSNPQSPAPPFQQLPRPNPQPVGFRPVAPVLQRIVAGDNPAVQDYQPPVPIGNPPAQDLTGPPVQSLQGLSVYGGWGQ